MNKLIVLGAPLTGKTTLASELNAATTIPVLDFDTELMRLNGGKYPANYAELNESLKKQILQNVTAMDEVVFFAFEIDIPTLQAMKEKGFRVVQLTAPLEILRSRNQDRLQREPNNDAFQYVTKNLQYQTKISELGLIDITIDTSSLTLDDSVKKIVVELQS